MSQHQDDFILLGEAGINIRIDLGDASRCMNGDTRSLLVTELREGSHDGLGSQICRKESSIQRIRDLKAQ